MLSTSSGARTGNLRPFSKAEKTLAANGFDTINGFEMYSVAKNAKVYWHECNFAAAYKESKHEATYAFILARSDVLDIKDVSLYQFTKKAIQLLQPLYGIGYKMPRCQGPELYTIGITYGVPGYVSSGEEYERDLSICRWGDIAMERQLYREGLLRDVYLLNLLNNVQLNQKIGYLSLEQWIKENINRGRIEKLESELAIWYLEDEMLDSIRHTLKGARVIFDWRLFI